MNMHDEVVKYIHIKGYDLVWINDSIGYRIADTVYLNVNLLKYPEYCWKIVRHECNHKSGELVMDDILLDIKDVSLWDNISFCLKHPRGFVTFLPVSYHERQLAVDPVLICIYLFVIAIIYLFAKVI